MRIYAATEEEKKTKEEGESMDSGATKGKTNVPN